MDNLISLIKKFMLLSAPIDKTISTTKLNGSITLYRGREPLFVELAANPYLIEPKTLKDAFALSTIEPIDHANCYYTVQILPPSYGILFFDLSGDQLLYHRLSRMKAIAEQ
jgi:hypothetical protein